MISLKSFVPDTIGMTYNKPDGTSALVPLGNDKFYIPQGVKTCFIRVNKNNNFHNGIRNFKGIQLKTMLEDLQPSKKRKVSETTRSVLPSQHIQDNVTMNQETVKANINEKHIKSRWYHCSYDSENYLQKSDSTNIKTKTLDIYENQLYDKQQISEKIKNLFYDDFTKPILDDSTIELANLKFQTIPSFENIFQYLKSIGTSPSRMVLILLTKAKNPITISTELENFPVFDCQQNKNLPTSSRKINNSSSKENYYSDSNQSSNISEFSPVNSSQNSQSTLNPSLSLSQTKHVINLPKNKMPDTVESFTILYCLPITEGKEYVYKYMPKRDLYDTLRRTKMINEDYHNFDPVLSGYPISNIIKNGVALITTTFNDKLEVDSTYVKFPTNMRQDGHKIIYSCEELRGMCNGEFGIGVIPSCCGEADTSCAWYKNGKKFKEGTRMFWIMCDKDKHPWLDDWKCIVTCNELNRESKILSCSANKMSEIHKNSKFTELQTPVIQKNNSLICIPSSSSVKTKSNKQFKLPDLPKSLCNSRKKVCINPGSSTYNNYNSYSSYVSPILEIKLEDFQLPVIKQSEITITSQVLGKGGQGKVFKAKWKDSLYVAVKTIEITRANYPSLMEEMKVLQFVKHTNIIQTLGIFQIGDDFNIVMDLIDGLSLSNILFNDNVKEEYDLSIKKRNYIASQISSGVHYMHSSNIIHGDIKPDNIMITRKGLNVKICDFGFSKLVNFARMTNSVRLPAGTYIYMAPELLLNNFKNSIASDVWAVGCTLNELYLEKLTWNAKSEMELRGWFKQMNSTGDFKHLCLDSIPQRLRSLVKRFLSFDQSKRPSVVEVNKIYDDASQNWRLFPV